MNFFVRGAGVGNGGLYFGDHDAGQHRWIPAGFHGTKPGISSRQFGEILAAAGLVKVRSHHAEEKDRKGRSARRTASEVSFHCLRHTAVSLLKNAGVSDAVAQDLVGHESAEISRLYTHIDDATKLTALNKLPVIG